MTDAYSIFFFQISNFATIQGWMQEGLTVNAVLNDQEPGGGGGGDGAGGGDGRLGGGDAKPNFNQQTGIKTCRCQRAKALAGSCVASCFLMHTMPDFHREYIRLNLTDGGFLSRVT